MAGDTCTTVDNEFNLIDGTTEVGELVFDLFQHLGRHTSLYPEWTLQDER